MVCPIPRSGRLGFVGDFTGGVLTRFPRIRNWRWNTRTTPDLRVYSGTRYGTQRVPSFVEYDISFQGWGASPPLFIGDAFTFIGYTAPTTGVPCTPGCAYSVAAMVQTLSITWNWTNENKTVFWEIGAVSDGDVTVNAVYDDPCDDTAQCFENTCNLGLRLKDPCAADAVVEFCNITQAVLTFTAAIQGYSNSSTACRVKREAGPFDFTLDIVDQNPCFVPLINKDYRIEIDATTTTFWLLKWAMVQGFTDYVIDTESNEMIGKTNQFGMQAVSCCVPGTPVRGEIKNPAAATLWPYATPA